MNYFENDIIRLRDVDDIVKDIELFTIGLGLRFGMGHFERIKDEQSIRNIWQPIARVMRTRMLDNGTQMLEIETDNAYVWVSENCTIEDRSNFDFITDHMQNGDIRGSVISICDDCGHELDYHYDYVRELMTCEYSIVRDDLICEACFEMNYQMCESCGDYFHCDDTIYNEHDGYCYCEECYEDVEFAYDRVNDYHVAPQLEFKGDSTTGRYFGVELEVDDGSIDNDEMAEILYTVVGTDLFYQYDSSLNNGFEIISHPCTLNYHKECLDWSAVMSELKYQGYLSHDTATCGLHVHVSRDSLGDNYDTRQLNIAKILLLIDNNWEWFVKFSRRDVSKIQRWAAKPNADIKITDDIEDIKNKLYGISGKYRAVNIGNSATIEFRMFRGTLKYNTFIATLNMIDLLIDFCMSSTLEDVLLADMDTIFKDKYESLDIYLEERGL